MSWGMVVAAGATLIGGAMQSRAGERGADAQAQAAQAAQAAIDRRYDQVRQDLAPYIDNGGWASGQQRNYLAGDMSGFINSAGYQAANRNGLQALEYGATAAGNLWGGGADADRIRFGQDNAWRFGSEYFNQLGGLANQGLNAGSTLGSFGTQAGQQASQNIQTGAAARASSYANTANAWSNALNQGASLFGQYQNGQPVTGSGWNGQPLPGQTVPNQNPWWG